jgi:hypothetical protein
LREKIPAKQESSFHLHRSCNRKTNLSRQPSEMIEINKIMKYLKIGIQVAVVTAISKKFKKRRKQ